MGSVRVSLEYADTQTSTSNISGILRSQQVSVSSVPSQDAPTCKGENVSRHFRVSLVCWAPTGCFTLMVSLATSGIAPQLKKLTQHICLHLPIMAKPIVFPQTNN